MNRKLELLALIVCERVLEDRGSKMVSLVNNVDKIEVPSPFRAPVSVRLECYAKLAEGEEGRRYQCQWQSVVLPPADAGGGNW
jgi:hypothetical protein